MGSIQIEEDLYKAPEKHPLPLKIYFVSPYSKPKIHYCLDTWNGNKWLSQEMKKSKKQRDLYVFKSEEIHKMLFVFCDQEEKNWYNPDIEQCKSRYFLNNNEKYEADGYKPQKPNNFNFYINTARNPTKHRFLVFDGQVLSIKKRQYKKQLSLVVDLDDTLICHKSPMPYETFKKFYCKNFLFCEDIKLIYNTGRSYKHFMQLQKNVCIFYPDYLILSAGTEIFDCSRFEDEKNYTGLVRDESYQNIILENFDSEVVKKVFQSNLPWIVPYKFEMENPRRVAYIPLARDVYKNRKEIDQVKQIMSQDYGMDVNVIISGNDINLFMDVVSVKGNKGNGTIYCVEQMMKRNMNTTVSFGDSENDIEMFQVTQQSFLVRNAQQGLKYWYQQLSDEMKKKIKISPMEYSYAVTLYLQTYFDL